MKQSIYPITIALVALSALAFAQHHDHAHSEPPAKPKPVEAKMVKGVQVATITIDNGTYTPNVVAVKKGKPVKLTFVAGKKLGCGGVVVVPSLKLKRELKGRNPVTLEFTPKKAGTIAYTCSMDMYHGSILVK